MKTKMRILISGILILLIVLALTVSATSSGEVTFSTSTFSTLADFNTTAVTLGSVWASRGTVSLDEYVDDIDAVKLTYTQESTQWLLHFTQASIDSYTTKIQDLYDAGSRGMYVYVHNDTGLSVYMYPHILNQNGDVTWVSLLRDTNAYLIAEDNLAFSRTAVISGEGIKVPADFRGYLVFPYESISNGDANNGTESIVEEDVMDDIYAGKFGFYSRTLSNVEPAANKNFYIFNYGTYKPNALSTNYTPFVDFNSASWGEEEFETWPGTPETHGHIDPVTYGEDDALRLTFGTSGSDKICQFAEIDVFATVYGTDTIESATPSDKTGIYIKVDNDTTIDINYFMKFLYGGQWYTNTVGSQLLLISSSDLANPVKATVVSGVGIVIPAHFLGYIVIPYNTISNSELCTSSLPVSGYTTDDIYQKAFGAFFNAGDVTFGEGDYLYILDYGAYESTPAGPTPIEYNVSRPELGTIPTLNKSQAQQVAANILVAPKPDIGDEELASLSLPEGYSETIYTTDYEDIIDTDGTITSPDNYTLARVVYEITKQGDEEKGYSLPLQVLIPATERIIDNDSPYLYNLYTDTVADFETDINGFGLWGNTSGLDDPTITRETSTPLRGTGSLKVVMPEDFDTGWIGIQSVDLPGADKAYDGIVLRMKTNSTQRTSLRAYIGQGANNYDFNENVIMTDLLGDRITTENAGEENGDAFFLPTAFDGYIYMPIVDGFDTTDTFTFRMWFATGDSTNGFDGATVNIDDINFYSSTATNSAIINDIIGLVPNSYANLRYGLMIHMSANNNTVDLGCGYVGPLGEDLGGMSNYTNVHDLSPIIDDIADMQFEYVMISNFHGLGVSLHPSAALDYYRGVGVYSSKRDFLGELISGLKDEGIKVMLMTHPLNGPDYSEESQEELGWNDSTNNYERWNNFLCDVYADIISRYGEDLYGVAYDSEFGLSGDPETEDKLDVIRLRDTIRQYSNLPLISLVPANQLTNYSIKEVWRPSWHDPWMSRSESVYDADDWPAYYEVPALVTTDHWGVTQTLANSNFYMTTDKLYRYMVLQACVATDGPGLMWGTSPYFDGQWETGVRTAYLAVGTKIGLVKESLQKVVPSKSYIRREGQKISALPNGIAATSSLDGQYEYIHVLNHPTSGYVLTLPPPTDGKRFTSACTLNPSHEVDLSQASDGTVTLTLQSEEEWDEVDTVIRLTNTNVDSKNLALFKPVLYSSSVESTDFSNIGWGNIRAVDGNTTYVPQTESWSFPLYGWSSNGRSSQLSNGESEWITIDLKSSYLVNNVMLYPRSDTGNENLGFPTNFTIKTSLDNVNWTTSLAKTNYPKPNGSAIFTFNTVNARYIKVEATELTRVPKISGNYFFQLGEIEIYYNPDSINATGVKLNKSNISITVISTETLIATVIPTNSINQNVSWTSSNPNVSTVSENGVVTAVSIGTANITAITADGGFVANCVVSVTPVTQELFLSSNLNNDDSQNWEFKGVPGNGSWFYIRNISSNLYLSYIGGQCVISAFTGGAEQYFSCDKLGGNMSLVNLLNQGEGLSNLSGQLTMSEAYPTITFSTPFINFFPLNSVNFGNVPNGTILYVGTISFKEAEINYYLTYGEKPPVDFGKYIVNLNKTRISNIQPNSSINDFLAFVNVRSDTDLVFSNISPNNIINTGTTIDIMVNGVLTDTYTIVIYGDVDGNGIINITDLAAIKAHLLDIFVLSGANLEAGDIFTTGSISISDLVAIKKHLLAIQFITQKYE